jgi:thiosulfate reductase cytochrome b subunit
LPADRPLRGGRVLVFRHPLAVRLTHWVNLACVAVLLASGLQILCAHPAFYWGEASRFAAPWAGVEVRTLADGSLRGEAFLMGARFDATGWLGVVLGADGALIQRPVPSWATLPAELDLGAGRRWHFFFAWLLAANGAVWLLAGLAGGRLPRAFVPSRAELAGLPRSLLDHLRLRFDHGEAARAYNVLQKLAYLAVALVLLPGMIVTGLAMSPTLDAWAPLLPSLLGGRQSARTLHFLFASGVVAFVLVHVAMVLAAGPINQMRAMVTGWFVIRPGKEAR